MPPAKGTPAYEAWIKTEAYTRWRANMAASRRGRFTAAQRDAARANVAKAQAAQRARGFKFTPEQRAQLSAQRTARAVELLGPAGVTPETQRCTRCKQVKPEADFTRDRQKRNGLRPACRQCEKDLRDQTAEARRRARIVRIYGVDPDWFDRTLKEQDGRCAICPQPLTDIPIAVDHDHETGAVRGILCNWCNTGLGMFRDRIDVLISAAAYLRAHRRG